MTTFTDDEKTRFINAFYDNAWEFTGYNDIVPDNPSPFGMPWLWETRTAEEAGYAPKEGETIEDAANRWYSEHRDDILDLIRDELTARLDAIDPEEDADEYEETQSQLDEVEALIHKN